MSELLETIEDGVATLTMNRPEARNAMGGGMIAALLEALPRLGADNSVRCVVLTGAGGAFCAGGDVKSFAEGSGGGGKPPTLEQRSQMLRPGSELRVCCTNYPSQPLRRFLELRLAQGCPWPWPVTCALLWTQQK